MVSAKEILLKARKNVFTDRASEALSKMRGDGLDFCEIRPYQAGDDVRKINFSASAKNGELQTNIFNENKQINTTIAVMLSSSLFFGSKALKVETVARVVANLGYSALKQKNRSTIILFRAENKEIFALNNEGDLLRVLETILSTDLLNIKEDVGAMGDYLLARNKAMMLIVGDFYWNYEYGVLARKHQLHAIIVRDKLEEMPNFGEELSLVNPQNSGSRDVNMSTSAAKRYQHQLHQHDNKILAHFKKHQVIFGKIFTCDDVFLRLNTILS